MTIVDAVNKVKNSLSQKAQMQQIIIPHDQMSGDVNGDGYETTDDPIYLLYRTMFGEEKYPTNLTNLDFNNDGKVTASQSGGDHNTDDSIYLLYYLNYGQEEYPIDKTTVYGNWIYDTDKLKYYCNIPINGILSSSSLFIISDNKYLKEVEITGNCLDNSITIYAERPPIEDVACNIIFGPGDGSISTINTTPSLQLQKSIDDKEIKVKQFNLPADRMLGDANGDGIIDEADISLIKTIYTNNLTVTNEEQLWACDISGDGVIDEADANLLNSYVNTNTDFTQKTYENNWEFDTAKKQFYTTIQDKSAKATQSVFALFDDNLQITVEPKDGKYVFYADICPIHKITCSMIIYNKNSNVSAVHTVNYSPNVLPKITAADAGKILTVSADGTWVLESLPQAAEVAF